MARTLLVQRGLPEVTAAPFTPAATLAPYPPDDRYLVIGTWTSRRFPILLHGRDGTVACDHVPHAEIYRINTSLPAFVSCLQAIDDLGPLSEAHHGSLVAAGDRVLAAWRAIDPQELADDESFWLDIADDIRNGDYDPDIGLVPPG